MTDADQEPVHLVDLKAAHAAVADEVRDGFEHVLANTAFIMGPDVSAFEDEYAAFTGTKHCVAVSSGTDALELAIRAASIGGANGQGDEVILPVNTFIATALGVARAGATPVFVDCDEDHMLIDPALIEARITDKTKAILPVHLYGQVAPMQPINDLAAKHGLVVMEDMAQSQGAKQDGKDAGTLSLAGGTSFYPGKNLGAYGDAGAVVTDDDAIAQRVRELRNYGSTQKYHHPVVGFNCRMDTLQAVVLRAKLKHLAAWNQLRRDAAARYDAMLEGIDAVTTVSTLPGNEHIYHLYVIRVANRDAVLAKLHEAKIGAGIHYPTPLHLTGAFGDLGYSQGNFPVAEKVAGEILSLPLFPQITEAQQQRVIEALKQAL